MGNKNKQQKRTHYLHSANEYCLARSAMVKYDNLTLPAHSNGIPTTCRLEIEFFSQLRNNPELCVMLCNAISTHVIALSRDS